MPRKKKIQLPAQGAAFAAPLADGRYCVCRVLLDTEGAKARELSTPYVLVAGSQWIGDEIPSAEDPALRPILHLTHHSWQGQPVVYWVDDPVPPEFVPIGTIPPTAEEMEIPCLTFASWYAVPLDAFGQWRWDHDREALLAEEAEAKAAKLRQLKEANEQRKAALRAMTLEQLQTRPFFPRWSGSVPEKPLRASRKLMKETVRRLLELGPSPGEEERIAILKWCIESFNDLDEKQQFIETIEREDICEEFDLIVHVCGLGHRENLADEWREW